MRKFLLILTLLVSVASFGQPMTKLIRKSSAAPVSKDTANFNMSLTSRVITGWYNLLGNPHSSTVSGTQNGITMSSGSTSNWTPEGSVTAAQNGGTSSTSLFPADVGLDYIFNKKSAAPGSTASAHWIISGLTVGATYKINLFGSRNAGDARAMYYQVFDNVGSTTSSLYTVQNNAATIITFTGLVADGSGQLYLSAYGSTTTASSVYGYFNGVQIIEE